MRIVDPTWCKNVTDEESMETSHDVFNLRVKEKDLRLDSSRVAAHIFIFMPAFIIYTHTAALTFVRHLEGDK